MKGKGACGFLRVQELSGSFWAVVVARKGCAEDGLDCRICIECLLFALELNVNLVGRKLTAATSFSFYAFKKQ